MGVTLEDKHTGALREFSDRHAAFLLSRSPGGWKKPSRKKKTPAKGDTTSTGEDD